MIQARKSVARARSMMASGNPVPLDARLSEWAESQGQATLERILSEAGGPAGEPTRRAWLAERGRLAWLGSATRPPSDLFGAKSAKRLLVPVAAAIAVTAIAVTLAMTGQLASGRGTSPGPASGSRAGVVGTIAVGQLPFGVAVNSGTGTVYVTNLFESLSDLASRGSVSVISARTNEVTGTVRVQNSPFGVAVNPLTDTIYVVNSMANDPQGSRKHGTVSVINGHTNKVTATIRVGRGAFSVAADPQTDTIYVVNASTVSVIDGHTNKVTATIDVGQVPEGVAVDPLTDTIYVTELVGKAVSVINGHTNKVIATVQVGSHPFGVAVNAPTDTIYVTNADGDSLSVIDGHALKVTATIMVGRQPQGVAVDPGTSTVYVTNLKGDTVTLIDGVTNAVMATVAVDRGPQGVDVNPVTGLAYVANELSNTVSVISP